MQKKKTKIILFFIAGVIIIYGIVLLVMIEKETHAEGELKDSITKTISINGNEEKIQLLTYEDSAGFTNYLRVNTLLLHKEIKLSGFEENDLNFCTNPKVNLGENLGDAICLVGDVGAHSKNIQFVSYKNNHLSSIMIDENGAKSPNIYSDVPNFSISDYNSDGYLDLVIDERNYDLDPLKNIQRKYYRGDKNGFVFDKETALAL